MGRQRVKTMADQPQPPSCPPIPLLPDCLHMQLVLCSAIAAAFLAPATYPTSSCCSARFGLIYSQKLKRAKQQEDEQGEKPHLQGSSRRSAVKYANFFHYSF